jgi:hypothetical protein
MIGSQIIAFAVQVSICEGYETFMSVAINATVVTRKTNDFECISLFEASRKNVTFPVDVFVSYCKPTERYSTCSVLLLICFMPL